MDPTSHRQHLGLGRLLGGSQLGLLVGMLLLCQASVSLLLVGRELRLGHPLGRLLQEIAQDSLQLLWGYCHLHSGSAWMLGALQSRPKSSPVLAGWLHKQATSDRRTRLLRLKPPRLAVPVPLSYLADHLHSLNSHEAIETGKLDDGSCHIRQPLSTSCQQLSTT